METPSEKPKAKRLTKAQKLAQKREALGKFISLLAARSLVARYDSLNRQPTRKVTEIRTDLSETEQVFTAEKRVLAYAKCDNLYDNTALSSILDTSIRLTIGKRGGTPLFTGPDKDTMQEWFTRWKRSAGYAEGESYYEMLALILRLVKLHGDCIVWIDPILTDGRIRIFDADQICNVAIADFEKWKLDRGLPDSCRQVEGVVVDGTGRVHGYFVTMLRNRYSISIDDAIFLPISTCRRVSYHRKHTQFRGEPAAFLANEELTEDTKSLLKSEIAAAKLASELPLVVEQPDGFDSNVLGSLLEGYQDLGEVTEGTGISADDIEKLGEASKIDEASTFKAFEDKASIAMVKSGTKVTNLTNAQRPSTQIQEWINVLNDTNGRALGVMSCLSRGRADNSYSSGQIEIEISWKSFEEDQKLLERDVVDYVMATLYPNAEYEVYWPSSIQIDPEKNEKTLNMMLQGGRTTYREILGSDWKQIIDQLAEEKAYLKEKGLDNLTFFQTQNGNESTEVMEEHSSDKDIDKGNNK